MTLSRVSTNDLTANGVPRELSSCHTALVEGYVVEGHVPASDVIELLAEGNACRRFLKPGAAPEAVFCVDAEDVSAREHCNKHGLWKT